MSCGACHIAFTPLKPPADPEHPAWENIDGLVGNQYGRISEIMASGMSREQHRVADLLARASGHRRHVRGSRTTQVSNPGTMNPIMNLAQPADIRGAGDQVAAGHLVRRWRGRAHVLVRARAGRKCWERSQKTERVHHILKGGEDSIGALEAIQRVYFNIGSCSEQCWVNHITDLRQADPKHRGFGQTPFDIGQCRRDCANFRAIEDRLQNIADFFMTSRPADLYRARGLAVAGGAGRAARSRVRRQRRRARQGGLRRDVRALPLEPAGAVDAPTTDFRAAVEGQPDLRMDFLSNERPVPVTEVGTSRSRALHSNHMKGHVWEEYGSETLRARPPVDGIDEPHDGGRGYYRPISLLSVWAFAPFMHNNAIGPEVCGKPTDPLSSIEARTWCAAPGCGCRTRRRA